MQSPDWKPIWDPGAEEVVLGGMLTSVSAVRDAAEILRPGDFYRPVNEEIFKAIMKLAGEKQPHDVVAVLAELTRRGSVRALGDKGPLYLSDLISKAPLAASVGHYARIVRDKAVLRALDETGLRMQQLAHEGYGDPADILTRAEEGLQQAGRAYSTSEEALDIESFAASSLPNTAPVIPGLLHQQERLLIVAPEGQGKSILGLQAAVMTAAGRHVFTFRDMEPCRSLYVDLENPAAAVRGRTAKMLEQARAVPGWDPARCQIWSKPGGVDLRDASDQRMVMGVIDRAEPMLITAGPAYKMSVDRGERAEQLYSTVTAFWDRVRDRHGSALWLEHHAPMGPAGSRELRPVGSGIWMRWPEYGVSLAPSKQVAGALDVGTFRGHREERVWPTQLQRGRSWPWEARYEHGMPQS